MADQFSAFSAVSGGMPYYVDIVMCIDATGSMSPIIDEVKRNAMDFCQKFQQAMEENKRKITELRIKVIAFRDFAYDAEEDAMNESPFYVLPQENEAFSRFVEQIEASGGGEDPENSLEAIALAMRSDWTRKEGKQRHVILLYTDAPAAPLCDSSDRPRGLRKRIENPYYPKDMPKDFTELSDMWEMSQGGAMPNKYAKRFIAFAPNAAPWNSIVWNNSWINYSNAGQGLSDIDIDTTLRILVNSIGG